MCISVYKHMHVSTDAYHCVCMYVYIRTYVLYMLVRICVYITHVHLYSHYVTKYLWGKEHITGTIDTLRGVSVGQSILGMYYTYTYT